MFPPPLAEEGIVFSPGLFWACGYGDDAQGAIAIRAAKLFRQE